MLEAETKSSTQIIIKESTNRFILQALHSEGSYVFVMS